MHHSIELIGRPKSDPGFIVGRDVRSIEIAEWRRHRASAGELQTVRLGVTCDAIAGSREVFAQIDDLGGRIRLLRSHVRQHAGLHENQARDDECNQNRDRDADPCAHRLRPRLAATREWHADQVGGFGREIRRRRLS